MEGKWGQSPAAELSLEREESLGLELSLARQRGRGPGTELATSSAISETSSRPSKKPRELSPGGLFPVMIYSIKLYLKISSAGGSFSAGPGCGRAQSAAS